jgi:hypothetical protein
MYLDVYIYYNHHQDTNIRTNEVNLYTSLANAINKTGDQPSLYLAKRCHLLDTKQEYFAGMEWDGVWSEQLWEDVASFDG